MVDALPLHSEKLPTVVASVLVSPGLEVRYPSEATSAGAPSQDHYRPLTILRLPEVMQRIGLKHAAIYQRIAEGTFPKQIPLGGRAVGWLEHEIDAWLAAHILARNCAAPNACARVARMPVKAPTSPSPTL